MIVYEYAVNLDCEVRVTTSGNREEAERIIRLVVQWFNSDEAHDALTVNGSINIDLTPKQLNNISITDTYQEDDYIVQAPRSE